MKRYSALHRDTSRYTFSILNGSNGNETDARHSNLRQHPQLSVSSTDRMAMKHPICMSNLGNTNLSVSSTDRMAMKHHCSENITDYSFSILNGSNGNETYSFSPRMRNERPFSILNGSNGNETYDPNDVVAARPPFQYPQRIEWQ